MTRLLTPTDLALAAILATFNNGSTAWHVHSCETVDSFETSVRLEFLIHTSPDQTHPVYVDISIRSLTA